MMGSGSEKDTVRKKAMDMSSRTTADLGRPDGGAHLFFVLFVRSRCASGKTFGNRGGAFKIAAGAERGDLRAAAADQGASRLAGAFHGDRPDPGDNLFQRHRTIVGECPAGQPPS